jgi:dihydroneopterin aldolase
VSDQIRITGIKAFGYHGVLPHEATDGQEFTVDLLITLDLRAASLSDDLQDTINYADLARIAHENIVGERVQLIERLAGRIGEEISSAYSQITSVSVTVHKPHAPVAVDFEDISVTITK